MLLLKLPSARIAKNKRELVNWLLPRAQSQWHDVANAMALHGRQRGECVPEVPYKVAALLWARGVAALFNRVRPCTQLLQSPSFAKTAAPSIA